VGRLNKITTEKELSNYFEQFGKIYYVRVVKDIITGLSRGYAFVEFKHSSDCRKAFRVSYFELTNLPDEPSWCFLIFVVQNKNARNVFIDGKRLLIDIERERSMKNWVPRRFGM
jgi:U11/U12 small nuclear ribonucleoprotein 35 kDa protein